MAISVRKAEPRTIAAVRARVRSDAIPAVFKRYLDQVYEARSSGVELDGQNIFIYHDVPDQPGFVDADFGVGTKSPFAPVGNVHPVALPVGQAAVATHRGPYQALRQVHQAVLDWCEANGHAIAGPHWEVYGHWAKGEPPTVDVYYLLR